MTTRLRIAYTVVIVSAVILALAVIGRAQIAGTSGPLNDYVNVRSYPTITAAHAAAVTQGRGLLVSTNVTISTAMTITVPVTVVKGGRFTATGGGTLAINGPFSAGHFRVFTGFSAGDVTFGANTLKEADPHWWGLEQTGTGSVNRIALQSAIDAVYDPVGASERADVVPHAGVYDLDGTTINLRSGVNVLGAGKFKTVFRSAGASNHVFTADNIDVFRLSGMDIYFTVTRTDGAAVYITGGSSQYVIEDMRIEEPYYGIYSDNSHGGEIRDIQVLTGGSGGSIYIGFYYRNTVSTYTRNCSVQYGNFTVNYAAFYIDSGNDGLWFYDCGSGASGGNGGMIGFYLNELTPASFPPRWIFLTDCGAEGGGGTDFGAAKDGIVIVSATDVHIDNAYIASSDVGINIQGGNGITVSNSSVFNNGEHGISISGGNYVQVTGSNIHNNGRKTAATYSGISVLSDVSGFTLQGNKIGRATNYGTETDHVYDILIADGTSNNYSITHNWTNGGSSGHIYNGGTGTNQIVRNNIQNGGKPEATAISSIASAPSYTGQLSVTGKYSGYLATGTTDSTNWRPISNGWYTQATPSTTANAPVYTTLYSTDIPGGLLGPKGFMTVNALYSTTASTYAKIFRITYGGAIIADNSTTVATGVSYRQIAWLFNNGTESSQTINTNASTIGSLGATATTFSAVNSAVTQSLIVSCYTGTTSAYCTSNAVSIEIKRGD